MHTPSWSLFFDFHTMPNCPDVGSNFDFDRMADRIKSCGVDLIVFPARCNLGMAYYDTQIGIKHPSLKYDLLGKLIEACAARDIKVSAYINVGLSHEEGARRRDWLTVSPEGYVYRPNRMDNFFRRMCYNSPYAEHLLAMIREIAENYPVAGMFFDCMVVSPCVGVECVREMKTLGYDHDDPHDLWKFGKMSLLRLTGRIAEALKPINSDLLLYFNGVTFAEQASLGNYLEYECLGRGCYDGLPLTAHYGRNLGKPVLNMIGRFHKSWADFGGLRSPASLEYDLALGLSNTMRCSVGDHFHPRGDIMEPVFDLIEGVYRKFQRYDPWLRDARALTDIALLVPSITFDYSTADSAPYIHAACGACRMLDELHYQFDVITPDMDFSQFRCLIVPDRHRIGSELAKKLSDYLNAGGRIISSGWSGMASERDEFALAEWPVHFAGESVHAPAYFTVTPEYDEGIPRMPITLYDPGTSNHAKTDSRALAIIVAPVLNFHWDGEHGNFYTPPDKPSGETFLAANSNVAHFSHLIFSSYYRHSQPQIRQLMANLLNQFLPDPLVKIKNLPPWGRITVTAQPGRLMIHLMNYHPESPSPDVVLVDDPVPLRNVSIRLRNDGRQVGKMFRAPNGEPLEFKDHAGHVDILLPEFNGYTVLVAEDDHGADE